MRIENSQVNWMFIAKWLFRNKIKYCITYINQIRPYILLRWEQAIYTPDGQNYMYQ